MIHSKRWHGVGTAISGAGGITVGGSSIVDTVLSSKNAKKIFNEYNTTMDEVKEECIEIGKILNNSSNNMATEYKTWCSFWSKLALGVTATSAGSWSAIVNPIIKSLRLASVGEDVAAAGFRGISVAGRAFTFAGGVMGILLLPLDIYTLVDSSVDVHNKNPHKVSIKIRKICSKIKADFLTDEEIQHMIHDTFSRRPILVREAYNQIVM
ncbi:unnamed protein product [Mytilus edulis]|uniref:Uncharacterized protein n=1 Tax=Mytilus edulis TaxID=6550 RepID=A0A8S3S9C9_MYTED|nr:unnamed protein product [Mytilus edulis]